MLTKYFSFVDVHAARQAFRNSVGELKSELLWIDFRFKNKLFALLQCFFTCGLPVYSSGTLRISDRNGLFLGGCGVTQTCTKASDSVLASQ